MSQRLQCNCIKKKKTIITYIICYNRVLNFKFVQSLILIAITYLYTIDLNGIFHSQRSKVDIERSCKIIIFKTQVLANRLLVIVVGMSFYAMLTLSKYVSGQKSKMVSISYTVTSILSGGE